MVSQEVVVTEDNHSTVIHNQDHTEILVNIGVHDTNNVNENIDEELLTIPPSCEGNDTHEEASNSSDPNGIGHGNVCCIDKSKSGTSKCRRCK